MTQEFLSQIKVGDRVWVEHSRSGSRKKLKTIARITPTQFVTGDGMFDRYRRVDGGCQVRGGHGGREYITGIATTEERAAYDAMKAKEETERKEREETSNALEVRRNQLRVLFDCREVNVSSPMFADNRDASKWDVTFYGLSEEQVRELAEKVKAGKS